MMNCSTFNKSSAGSTRLATYYIQKLNDAGDPDTSHRVKWKKEKER